MRLTARRWRQHGQDASPSVGFVLSGGASLAAAQVGALRALLEDGIQPQVVIGTSAGALNAAYIAHRPTVSAAVDLERVWTSLTAKEVFGTGLPWSLGAVLRRRGHLADPDALRCLIRRFAPMADLAHGEIPCHVVTTDLVQGRTAIWSAGHMEDVLCASACLPGIFPPVLLTDADGQQSLHVDGGVLAPVPTREALALGVRRLYVLDVTERRGVEELMSARLSALGVLLRSFAVARDALSAAAPPVGLPDQEIIHVPLPKTEGIDLWDFSRSADLIRNAYVTVKEWLSMPGIEPAA